MKKKFLSRALSVALLTVLTLPLPGVFAETETSAPDAIEEVQKTEKHEAETPSPAKEAPSEESVKVETPEPTEAGEVSGGVPTAKESVAPEGTPAPEEMLKPEETTAPEETVAPEETEETGTTAAPEVTAVSEETVVPEETIVPEEAEETGEDNADGQMELAAKLSNVSLYAFVNSSVYAVVEIEGGTAPYEIVANGKKYTAEKAGRITISRKAEKGGELKLVVTVTDALGATVKLNRDVPIAVKSKGDAKKWIRKAKNLHGKLTGDWRKDVMMIAKSQLGYKESDTNFVIRKDGTVQGYTVYGDLYGGAYQEWCAMFVSFCLEYAGIPSYDIPRYNVCNKWRSVFRYLGVYEENEREYDPKPGDLIFFNWEGDEGEACHVGIVEKTGKNAVYTIEGNSARRVQRKTYLRNDPCIIGYANLDKLMMQMTMPKVNDERIESEADAEEP